MKNSVKILSLLLLFFGLATACTKEEDGQTGSEGTELRIGVAFGSQTRLAELQSPNDMGVEMNGNGLKNVGLYVYYASDYARGDVSKPYIRNQECTVVNGELLIVQKEGANPADSRIFIYDQMTLVAFYPYNPDVRNFTSLADEELYPITRKDYSQQYYIPYRAQTQTDPTQAYYTSLTFYPKHTYKVEITVVSDDASALPGEGDIRLLPANDPQDNPNVTTDGKRAAWFDQVIKNPNRTGGSNVNQYIGYIWTTADDKNEIKRGDVLLQSGNLTLIASQDVYVNEQNIYRYGYNMSTGEIFIPTSSNLIHDKESLQALNGSSGSAYQVCDIDLSSETNWTPVNLYGGTYDGGGHAITGMKITSTAGNTPTDVAGLFGQVQGNTTIANVHLVDPVIEVDNPATDPDNPQPYYVGALAGRLNSPLSEEARRALIANVPPDISPIVREALIEELMASMGNTTANIVASIVDNPQITVTGKLPYVGTITGMAGEKDDDGDYKSRIWDTASLGGSVTVNSSTPADNQNGYVGGFVGLNNGSIDRSFTTVQTLVPATNATPYPSTGFTTQTTVFDADSHINDSYTTQPDTNTGVQQMPGAWPSAWASYGGIWPINTSGWLAGPSNSFWYSNGAPDSTYPTLQWQRR